MLRRFEVLSLVLLMTACAPSPANMEATVQAAIQMTQTARPTATPIPTATSTPRPTPTKRPTPAPIGAVVPSGTLEITLLSAVERPTMHIGDIQGRHYIFYYAREGARIIDLAVLVHNTDPSKAIAVKWQDVYVVEPNGDNRIPAWAKVKSVDQANLDDPYTIGISSEEIDPEATVEFAGNTYLRLVFMVTDDSDATLRFHIGDSPRIEFQTTMGS